jgi:hypothetical protein
MIDYQVCIIHPSAYNQVQSTPLISSYFENRLPSDSSSRWTLAFRLRILTTKRIADFHHQVIAHSGLLVPGVP